MTPASASLRQSSGLGDGSDDGDAGDAMGLGDQVGESKIAFAACKHGGLEIISTGQRVAGETIPR